MHLIITFDNPDTVCWSYPLNYPDKAGDGCVLIAPLGIGVEVNSLLLKDQLMNDIIESHFYSRNANQSYR